MPTIKAFNQSTVHVPIHFDQLAEGIKQLTPSQLATLEIMLDEEFNKELLKRTAEMPRLIRQKKTLTHEQLKRKYS
jgi:hypothetical protein